jgi:hypothetical protein
MSFFNICWERKQLGGACSMHVPANNPYIFYKYPIPAFVVLGVSVCAVFHTSPPLLSSWQNYLISVGLSRLYCRHYGCASHSPWKSSFIALCIAFTFFVSTFILSASIFWKRNLKPLITRRFTWKVTAERSLYTDPKQPGTQLIHSRYLKSDHGKQLVNPEFLHPHEKAGNYSFVYRDA